VEEYIFYTARGDQVKIIPYLANERVGVCGAVVEEYILYTARGDQVKYNSLFGIREGWGVLSSCGRKAINKLVNGFE
jgi:hypothetical protein